MAHSLAKPVVCTALVGIVAAGLGGCREEEMGRPLVQEKGTYTGAVDEPLSPEAKDRLRRRISGQNYSGN